MEFSDVFHPIAAKEGRKYNIPVIKSDIRDNPMFYHFDLVFATQVLLHIPPDNIDDTIKNMILLSGGYIAIIVWYDKDNINRTGSYFDGNIKNSFSHDYPALFKKHNLKIIKHTILKFPRGTNNAWLLIKNDTK
jgi:hypothetical protein